MLRFHPGGFCILPEDAAGKHLIRQNHRTRFVLKRGADYLQNAGADAGLAVRLAYGFFAGGQNYAAPGAQLLQAAVLTATAPAGAVGQHIYDLFKPFLLVACQLAFINAQGQIAVKAGHSFQRHLCGVEICHEPFGITPGGKSCFQCRRLAASAATPVVHEENSLLDDCQQGVQNHVRGVAGQEPVAALPAEG